MKALCRNPLGIDYTAKTAIEDLDIAIRKAQAERNTEPSRNHGKFKIERKW